MEKVVIVGSIGNLHSSDAKDVNEYLDKGWTVKSIHTTTNKEYMTAIFVLEKK